MRIFKERSIDIYKASEYIFTRQVNVYLQSKGTESHKASERTFTWQLNGYLLGK